MKRKLLVSLLIFVASCGGGSGGSTPEENTSAEDLSLTENPIVKTQFFGSEGNLWKARADETASGSGLLVVLLSAQFTQKFDSCEVKLASGETAQLFCNDRVEWTQIPFSCFSNGNRQTWRASFSCDKVAEVKVTCRSLNQEVIFTVPEEQRANVCWRFG